MGWSAELPVVQFRTARPTTRLADCVRFYRDGLGLKVIGGFADHAGFSGVMLGLPGAEHHLELTEEAGGAPCPAPSPDCLLVFYLPDAEAVARIAARLAGMGYPAVPPHNPYWAAKGVTIPDPDGWRVVLMATAGITARAD